MVARESSVWHPSLDLAEDLRIIVLDIVTCAWQTAKTQLNAKSLETPITGRLVGEMLLEKNRRKIDYFRIEEEVGTRKSEDSPKPEGRIDIKIVYDFEEKNYWGIECKRVSGSKSDGLARKYVDEGVLRFASGKYSLGHPSAAMIGFVIDGNAAGAASLIAKAIKASTEVTASLCKAWAPAPQFGNHEHLYTTEHRQAGASEIVILHFFLPLTPK